nr:hypothetical protein [Fodinicola feengrottensis]
MAVRPAGVFQAAPNRYLATGWWRPPGGPSPHQVCRLPTRWWMSSWLRPGSVAATTSPTAYMVLVGSAPRVWRCSSARVGSRAPVQAAKAAAPIQVTQYAGWCS